MRQLTEGYARLFKGDEPKAVYGTIENRLTWDPYFQKAMELINE